MRDSELRYKFDLCDFPYSLNHAVSGDETLQKRREESDSEEEEEDVEEQIPTVDIAIGKPHPLSPEVTAKQVCAYRALHESFSQDDAAIGYCETLVRKIFDSYPRTRADFDNGNDWTFRPRKADGGEGDLGCPADCSFREQTRPLW